MVREATQLVVRKSATVTLPLEEAFALFTERIDAWWPRTHSIHGDEVSEVVWETRAGGRLFERTRDGREAPWGRVVTWEPPQRLVLEWKVNPDAGAPTELEVSFRETDAGTRVDLEHRGWERLGDAGADGYDSYDTGWDVVFGRYVEAAAP